MTLDWVINHLIDAVRTNNTADILTYSNVIKERAQDSEKKLKESYFRYLELKEHIKTLVS